MMRVTAYFYRKRDCHLCETMAEKLTQFRRANSDISLQVVARDIDDNAEWHARYWEYVPVLVVDDEEVCHYFFDADEFRAALKKEK